jgi:hypothetical protein
MKNSGVGGPVGTLSEIASVFGRAGCIMGCVVAFDFPMGISGMLAPINLIGCLQGEISDSVTGVTGCTACQASGACAVIGCATCGGAGSAELDFDHGQKLDDVAGGATGSGRRPNIAIDAGSASAVVAAKVNALTAAGIDLRQAVCMAVLLDVVDRRHPCRRLMVLN